MELNNLEWKRKREWLSMDFAGEERREELPFRFTGDFSWLDGEGRLQVTFRTNSINGEKKAVTRAKPMALQRPACRLQERNGGHGGRGTGGMEECMVLQPSRGRGGCPTPATSQAQI